MGNTSIKITEIMLEELEYLKNNLSSVNPQCVDNMFRFQCSQMYAKCDTSSSGTWNSNLQQREKLEVQFN